ncbi:phosphatase PAP2 family protein [bacterium]|nr:phosphatase PAP2 family protein [bacterium]
MQEIGTNSNLLASDSSVDAMNMPENKARGLKLPLLLVWMTAIPLALLAAITAVCYWTPLDLIATHQFFSPTGDPFPYRETGVAILIYDYGPIPAIVFGVGSIVVLIGSFQFEKLRPWRKAAFFCAVAITIGPGILINSVLKPNWGRPRPVDTIAFGGCLSYVPPGTIGPYEAARSFPSGHASMGFVFLLPGFLLLKKNRAQAFCVLAFGFLCGTIVGASRIAEGGHFLSDIAWSGAIVYFTGLVLYVAMYGWNEPEDEAIQEHPTVPFTQPENIAMSQDSRTNSAA